MAQDGQQKPPSWLNLFGWIEFTPEEEALLDEIWASPEMQAAVAEQASKPTPQDESDEA